MVTNTSEVTIEEIMKEWRKNILNISNDKYLVSNRSTISTTLSSYKYKPSSNLSYANAQTPKQISTNSTSK